MDDKRIFSKKKLIKDFLNFDWKNYIETYPDLKYIETKEDAWYHWINYGKHENRVITKLNTEEFENFDWKTYVTLYDDLKNVKTKEDAWNHWIIHGKHENRNIHKITNFEEFENFDWKTYVTLYDDLKNIKTKEDAWNHWINHGKNENRICENIFLFEDYFTFDWQKYINNYEDLQYITTKEEAWKHFINYGFSECRKMNDVAEIELNEYKKIIEDENIYEEIDYSCNKIYFKEKYTNCGKHLFGWKGTMNYLVENFKFNDKIFNKKYYFDEWLEKLLVWGNKILNKKCLDIITDNDLQLITFLHCPPFKYNNNNKDYDNLLLNDDSLLNENIIELINSKNLFYSIKYLYVLSIHHKNYIINIFPQFKNKILSLYHPINITNYNKNELFDINKFNDNKKIYHIGWWLRNFVTFFNLKLPNGYNKITLIKQEFKQQFDTKFTDIDENIKIINELKDDEYIKIFNNSCVFCDLVDCVANNVVLECIKYNTPIIIKRIPSVEEYLGKDYPLFFNDESELEIFKNEKTLITKISEANKYLIKMDKKPFMLETFLNKVNYDINKLTINDNKYKLTWLYYLDDENIDIEKHISIFNYQLSIENIKLIIVNAVETKNIMLDKYKNDNINIINVDNNLSVDEIYKIFIDNSVTEYLVFKKFNNFLNEEHFSDLCINYLDNNSTFDIIIFKNNKNYNQIKNIENNNYDNELNIDLQLNDDNSESSNESSILSNESNLNEMYQINDNIIETTSLNEEIESEKDTELELENNNENLLNSIQVENYNFEDTNINILWRKSIHSYITNFSKNFWINCHKNHLNIFEIKYKNIE